MADFLQLALVIIVIFIVVLATEIFFSFCRFYSWIKYKIKGTNDNLIFVPPGRYRKSSISHNWDDVTYERITPDYQETNTQQQQKSVAKATRESSISSYPSFRKDGKSKSFLSEINFDISDESKNSNLRPPPISDNNFRSNFSFSSSTGRTRASSSSRYFSENYSPNNVHFRRRKSASTGLPHDRILLANDFIKKMEVEWITGKNTCHNCTSDLSNERFILHDGSHFCTVCYENLFANICHKCSYPITSREKDLSCKNRHWHEKCFVCSVCFCLLLDFPFAFKGHDLYCVACYQIRFGAKCFKCKKNFKNGMKKYEYKGKQWHENCFCCHVCNQVIGIQSFVTKGDHVICIGCYGNTLQQNNNNCASCHLTISEDGIYYKDQIFHKSCFNCQNCGQNLALEKFSSVNKKFFCLNCFEKNFSKKCFRCLNPISGINNNEYISFNDKNFHLSCFKCQSCDLDLRGKGFLSENNSIFCPNCCLDTEGEIRN